MMLSKVSFNVVPSDTMAKSNIEYLIFFIQIISLIHLKVSICFIKKTTVAVIVTCNYPKLHDLRNSDSYVLFYVD